MSIAYSVSVNGADVSLGYASGNSGADNSSGTSIDKNATSINASIGIGDITVSLAQNKVSGDNADDNATQEYDISSNEYGVEYALSDSITLSAESRAVSGTATAGADYKHDQTGYGIAYTVASGVELSGTFTDFTNSNGTTDVSGTATVIKLAVSF